MGGGRQGQQVACVQESFSIIETRNNSLELVHGGAGRWKGGRISWISTIGTSSVFERMLTKKLAIVCRDVYACMC